MYVYHEVMYSNGYYKNVKVKIYIHIQYISEQVMLLYSQPDLVIYVIFQSQEK